MKSKSSLIVLLIAFVLFVTGCVSRIYGVDLDRPAPTALVKDIEVKDIRMFKEVFLTDLEGKRIGMFPLQIRPSEIEVLRDGLSQALNGALTNSTVEVGLFGIQIWVKGGGFFGNNELHCIAESKVTVSGDKPKFETIKSYSKNTETFAGAFPIIGKAILDQCLREHAFAIAKYVKSGE
jgi:hypothetical protein